MSAYPGSGVQFGIAASRNWRNLRSLLRRNVWLYDLLVKVEKHTINLVTRRMFLLNTNKLGK